MRCETLPVSRCSHLNDSNGLQGICFARETFHRPHPAKEAKRYQVRAALAAELSGKSLNQWAEEVLGKAAG